MNNKEKIMFSILVVIMVFTFIFEGVPILTNYYADSVDEIDQLITRIERLDKLLQKEDFWDKEYSKIKSAEEEKITQLFSAKSRELVAAKLQSLLKKMARENSVNLESLNLPEFKKNSQWLIISQSISIKGSTANIFNFIKSIESNNKKLVLSDIKLRSNRRQLRGSLTIVGFSSNTIKLETL